MPHDPQAHVKAGRKRIVVGNKAGGGFQTDGSLVVAYHATRHFPCGRTESGYFIKRKWLANRSAFNYEPTMGWAYEHWFEWPSPVADRSGG